MKRVIRRIFRVGEHTRDIERDVRDELSLYLEMRERELIERGASPEEAARLAREAFGDERRIAHEVEGIARARVRRRRMADFIGTVLYDVRFAMRGLMRTPAFAVAAVLTLGLGMGANTLVFGLLEAALLRAPAVRAPETLAAVYTTCRLGSPRCSSSYPDYLDYRERTAGTIRDIAVQDTRNLTLADGETAVVVTAGLVSGNWFELLGVGPARGRLIGPGDDGEGSDTGVAVLSHAFWSAQFGRDPEAVGRTITLNGVSHMVVGVASPTFRGLSLGRAPAVWVPLHALPALFPTFDPATFEDRGSRWMDGLVARLEDGVPIERARAALLGVSAQLAAEDSVARGPRTVTVDPLPRYVLPNGSESTIKAFLHVLQGVVGFTLLLACANLANLLLARGSARRREIGVRTALGAGRGRLMRQLMTESAVLSVLGAFTGLALAALALSLISGFRLPFGFDIAALGAGVNVRVGLFTAALAILTVLVFGVLPALHVSRTDVASVLRTARGAGPRTGRVLGALVAVQIVLCVVLLSGAGLFLRTLNNHLREDLGFRPEGLALLTVDPSMNQYTVAHTARLADDLLSRVAALPGVEVASMGMRVPLLSGGYGTFVEVEGYTPAPDEEMRVEYNLVGPDYLQTAGIRLLRGRDIASTDGAGGHGVVVINERAAETWWPGRDALGGTVSVGGVPFTVVGIAAESAWQTLEVGASPFLYAPIAQVSQRLVGPWALLARTNVDRVDALLPAMRAAAAETDPSLAITYLGSMEETVATTLAPQRGVAVLLTAFAALALALATIGIYGVVAYGVAQRRRDYGIRLALGARRAQLLGHVVRGMTLPVAAGVVVGVLGTIALGRTVRGMVYGVETTDPSTLLVTIAILCLAAAVATLIPARRAARSDPLEVMRAE